MDDMDRRIVTILSGNGRLSHEQLGREVHLSRPAVFERIRRLEAQGVIRGYGARVDWEALGLPLTAFVWIRTTSSNCNDSARQIAELKFEGGFLEEIFRITGEWCMYAKFRLTTPTALQQALDRIRLVPGVQNTMTTIALSCVEPARDGGAVQPALAGEDCRLPGVPGELQPALSGLAQPAVNGRKRTPAVL
jgi:Lrp/AsnC family leucine-responsive transcriptional regulator